MLGRKRNKRLISAHGPIPKLEEASVRADVVTVMVVVSSSSPLQQHTRQ
jgi:hypothetical protein